MLSILFSWGYMGVIAGVTGLALLQGFYMVTDKISPEKKRNFPSIGYILFLGIMGCTLYAQIWGIFSGISLNANLVLLVFITLYIFFSRKYILNFLRVWKQEACEFLPPNLLKKRINSKWERWILFTLIAIVTISYALASSGPVKLIDTDWYHAQHIRWLEEYGAVKGLGNLFPSLGYNNSQHYFDALFSLKWLFGQSMRTSGGFFGLALFIHGSLRVSKWNTHKSHIADMIGLWEIAYSIIVTAFYTDPYVDTLPNALVLVIYTEWVARLEEKKEDIKAVILDCLLCVFAVVCKLSVVMVILLALPPLFLLIRQRRWKEILIYLAMGLGIALPFFITNVMISGYLVYPVALVDIFLVPWKMDKEILHYTVDSMVAFARMPLATVEEALNSGFSWIPLWFKNESISHKILYLTILITALYDIGNMIRGMISLGNREKKGEGWQEECQMIWMRICIYLGLVYWFFSIPQVKYCWAFLILPLAMVPISYVQKERKNEGRLPRGVLSLSLGVLLMYSGFYGLRTLGYMKEGLLHYPIMQSDYQKYDLKEIRVKEHRFYIRKEGRDLTSGYYAFPYLDNPENKDNLVLEKRLKHGIYLRGKEE